MINIKIIVVFAGFAILVSLIGSGIRSVPLLQILLRTIIWGAVFAGIGAGVSAVIGKYLPELSRLLNGDIEGEKSYEGDFEAVIPEENPHETLDQDSLFSNMREDTEVDLGVKDESSELEELGAAEITKEDIPDDQPEDSIKDMGNLPYIDALSDDEQTQDENIDNLDALPEIDSFASSFTPYGGGNSDVENTTNNLTSMYSKPKTNMDLGGFVEDPLKTAKAIHTWIERDKEG